MDCEPDRAPAVNELIRRLKKEQEPMMRLASAIKELDQRLLREAEGYSLDSAYQEVPEILKGYVELVYAASNKLPVALVRNAAGQFTQPTLESVTAAAAGTKLGPTTDFRVSITNPEGARSYPIASYTWLLVKVDNPDAGKARALRDFLTWMITPEAQKMAADLGYAPLPDDVVGLVRDRIKTLKTGSRPIA